MRRPEYQIGERVYHITPESDCGVVVDIKYSYLTGLHEYHVTFGAGQDTLWYYEHELSRSKIF